MQLLTSVIICTHNPRRDYLFKVLQALDSQTLSKDQWELLLVDNASNELLSSVFDLSWHPQSRHIREEQLGLTAARLRGIKESIAETLVFVDDDNVLDTNYLEIALQISKDWSKIGSWGGQIRPEFEETPPDWTKKYWDFLAIREFEGDKWSNFSGQNESTPCGAGMCIRRYVAEKYAAKVINDFIRLNMDRRGKLLTSCGDTDLACTAYEMGLGTGQFAGLKLTHLLPQNRLKEDYLVKLIEGMNYSATLLEFVKYKMLIAKKKSIEGILIEFYRLFKMSLRERRFYKAAKRGKAMAIKDFYKIFSLKEL